MNFADYPHAIVSLGLIAAGLFALFRLDDVSFDLAFWMMLVQRKIEYSTMRYPKLTLEKLRECEQKRVAIFVPCWHESDVVDKMLACAARGIEYRNFTIFVGVYPNDPETIAKVESAKRLHRNVEMVVNDRPGPTTKAQNLNCMYRAMAAVEGVEGEVPYDIVVLHDVEDVIHPLSLMIFNYLIPENDMVQLPVIPLERKWNDWVAWTYSDEFAQNHMKDMVFRESIGAFVPCSGVGCGFSRKTLEELSGSSLRLFPEDSLTEDYRMAYELHRGGYKTIFVHQRMQREGVRDRSIADEYVATRAYFPDTFATAVRQKARWVSGIGLQTWKAVGWSGGFSTRYALYRDRKVVFSNIVPLFGYAVYLIATAMFVLHLLWPDRFVSAAADLDPLAIGLLALVLGLTILQLVQSALLIGWVYGPLQGLLYTIRIPIGSCINALATIRAWNAFLRSNLLGTPMTWAKTAHVFPVFDAPSASAPDNPIEAAIR